MQDFLNVLAAPVTMAAVFFVVVLVAIVTIKNLIVIVPPNRAAVTRTGSPTRRYGNGTESRRTGTEPSRSWFCGGTTCAAAYPRRSDSSRR